MRNLLTLSLALGLIAAACSPESTDDSTTTTLEDSSTTSSAAAESTTTSVPETTTTAPEETTTTAGEASGEIDDCVVGTWVLDNELFVENFSTIFAEAGMPDAEVSALDGTFTAEMGADGSLSGIREGWGFAVETGDGTFIIEINGTETGTWATDGSTLIVNTDESDIEVSSSVEVDGEIIEMPQDQAPLDTPSGIASNSEYTCDGDVLTMTNAGVDSVMNRQ